MEELIYLLIKAIAGAMDPKAKQARADQAWQQELRRRQWMMQQQAALAAAARRPVLPPPPLAVPVRPVQPVQPVEAVRAIDANWVDTERASRHDAGGARSLELTRLIRPASLRRRFILTEILRPPVSLRPPRI